MEITIGARIRALREGAGIQSQELAATLGIDPSAMSNIERDKRAVKTQELTLIAGALRVSPLTLLGDDSLPARLPVAARSTGGQVTDGAAYKRLLALSEIHSVLTEAGLPAAALLDEVPDVRQADWKTAGEALARWATEHLDVQVEGDERFSALAEAIENRLGIDVLVEQYKGDALSGAAITDSEFPLIFVNSEHPTPRSLFTLAHELGHLLSGHDGSITLDEDLSGKNQSEQQANAFAATFLMPREAIDEHIKNYGGGPEALLRMVYDFGVSLESLIFRLHNLGKINAQGRDRLRSVGWRGLLSNLRTSDLQERLGPEISMHLMSRFNQYPARRSPMLLASRCFVGHRRGVISVRPLAGLLDIDPELLLDDIKNLDESSDALSETDQSAADELSLDDDSFMGSPVA